MVLAERIKEARLNKNLKQEDIAKALGKTKSVISRWENGENKPDPDALWDLAELLEVNPNWLLGWKDVSLSLEEQEILKKIRNLKKSDRDLVAAMLDRLQPVDEIEDDYGFHPVYRTLDLYGVRPSAGTGNYLVDGMSKSEIQVINNKLTKKADFALKVDGHSMEPKLQDGDTILVQQADSIDTGEIGVFSVNGDVVVKQCFPEKLHSLNSDYDDIYLSDTDDVHCFGRVIGKV